jgi:hypothetical protein
MSVRRAGPSRRLAALFTGVALVGALAMSPANSAPTTDCPTVMPVADVQAGMSGTGYTVSEGTTPEPFDAEILGVYPDALLPGRDLIMAEVHSPAIDAVGGVWYGMSGSPVYVSDGGTDKLVGAVAFGFSFGPSHVIGLTAAEDMEKVLSYGAAAPRTPSRVKLSNAMQRDVAEATSTSASEVPDALVQLKVPVSVSGAGVPGATKVFARMQKRLKAQGIRARLYAGASASAAAAAAPGDMVPGSNFAAALSYGDLTFAAIGTTTFQCNGKAMAFGHPFLFEGASSLGANSANALTIYPDPVFSPFKLATVAGAVGIVDQDRFAGIRADFGAPPVTAPITSTTTAQNTARTQEGLTEVVPSDDEFAFPFLSEYHEYLQIISTMDQYSGGSGNIEWTISGTRADGTPWKLHRTNMVSTQYDIPYEAIHEFDHMIFRLAFQDFEDIHFTGVDFSNVTVREAIRQFAVSKVLVSVDGGRFQKTRTVRAKPGSHIKLRVTLNPYDENLAKKVVDLAVQVPKKARRDGLINVFGGPGHHTGIVGKASSFGDLLNLMRNDLPNNNVGVKLRIGRSVADKQNLRLGTVVAGGRSIRVRIGSSGTETVEVGGL